MQIQELLKIRKQKGYEIAKTNKIVQKDKKWIVPSQTSNKKYEVTLYLDKKVCTCLDYTERGMTCKHIFAVEITITKEVDNYGNVKETKIVRKTYPQDWANYNKAQINQKELFLKLLFDLCKSIPQERKHLGKGRPEIPMKDVVFSSALKIFTTFSLRRFGSDMKTAKELGYVEKAPYFSVVSKYMQKEELTPILQELIALSSMPLKSIETKFAIDSTGFRTTKFTDYCKEKHNIEKQHEWIKAHICTGVKTNIVTAVQVDTGTHNQSADDPQFIPLLKETHDNGFVVDEASADKAYSSRHNHNFVRSIGGTPFIAFRSNATGNSSGSYTWMRMYRYFTYNREEFLQHYHNRSNVETTVFMVKSKFTDLVRSKDETAQLNEVLLKFLCHNICVLIQESFELGIEPNFISGV